MRWVQLCSSLSILWHCLSLGLEWKLTFSSPVATAVLQMCWHIEYSTCTASSFRIWNSSTAIPSPPLSLFVKYVGLHKIESSCIKQYYLIPFRLLQQNIIDCMAYKDQKLLTVLEVREFKIKAQQMRCLMINCFLVQRFIFSLWPHTAEWTRETLWNIFYKGANLIP